MSGDYRNLIAWQWADAFACEVFLATRSFPTEELYGGLGSLLRTTAAKVPAQIVEGAERRRMGAYMGPLREAQIALAIADYYLILAAHVGYVDGETHAYLETLRSDAAGILSSFVASLETYGCQPERAAEEQRAAGSAGACGAPATG